MRLIPRFGFLNLENETLFLRLSRYLVAKELGFQPNISYSCCDLGYIRTLCVWNREGWLSCCLFFRAPPPHGELFKSSGVQIPKYGGIRSQMPYPRWFLGYTLRALGPSGHKSSCTAKPKGSKYPYVGYLGRKVSIHSTFIPKCVIH